MAHGLLIPIHRREETARTDYSTGYQLTFERTESMPVIITYVNGTSQNQEAALQM